MGPFDGELTFSESVRADSLSRRQLFGIGGAAQRAGGAGSSGADTSCTAAEALELCGKHNFDVVVTDYKMPKMNGIELIGRLRKLHPATSVILISGFTDTLGLDEATTGADIVLQKSNNEVPPVDSRSESPVAEATGAAEEAVPASQAGSKPDKRKAR